MGACAPNHISGHPQQRHLTRRRVCPVRSNKTNASDNRASIGLIELHNDRATATRVDVYSRQVEAVWSGARLRSRTHAVLGRGGAGAMMDFVVFSLASCCITTAHRTVETASTRQEPGSQMTRVCLHSLSNDRSGRLTPIDENEVCTDRHSTLAFLNAPRTPN